MALQHAYTLLAPFYDGIIGRLSRQWRQDSLDALRDVQGKNILIVGIGSGLDIPYLPLHARYTGIDLTPAMLKRASRSARMAGKEITLHQGDAMNLPYQDAQFDAIIMHLIIAVVPQPIRALAEAERVLKPGGLVLILDKFLRAGQFAPLRRFISPLLGKIATRTDVVFEDVLKYCPRLTLVDDVALSPGWFRRIVLHKE